MGSVAAATVATAAAATATVVADRTLKSMVERRLDEGERAGDPFTAHVVRRSNHTGAGPAFAIAGGALAAGIAAGGVALRQPLAVQVGAGMVAGAMATNLVDRVMGDRAVTDFLATPLGVVNAADVLLGAGLIIAGIGLVLR
jgi:lipoprotein signal peptidase